MKTKTKAAAILIFFFGAVMIHAQNQETTTPECSEEVETSPLMMFGGERKAEEKNKHTAGREAAGSTAGRQPARASLAGASELHFILCFCVPL